MKKIILVLAFSGYLNCKQGFKEWLFMVKTTADFKSNLQVGSDPEMQIN
jgi:hypothetical protein